jgi:SRSO17 transposase
MPPVIASSPWLKAQSPLRHRPLIKRENRPHIGKKFFLKEIFVKKEKKTVYYLCFVLFCAIMYSSD